MLVVVQPREIQAEVLEFLKGIGKLRGLTLTDNLAPGIPLRAATSLNFTPPFPSLPPLPSFSTPAIPSTTSSQAAPLGKVQVDALAVLAHESAKMVRRTVRTLEESQASGADARAVVRATLNSLNGLQTLLDNGAGIARPVLESLGIRD